VGNELSTFQFYQTVDLKWMLTSKSPIFVLRQRGGTQETKGPKKFNFKQKGRKISEEDGRWES